LLEKVAQNLVLIFRGCLGAQNPMSPAAQKGWSIMEDVNGASPASDRPPAVAARRVSNV